MFLLKESSFITRGCCINAPIQHRKNILKNDVVYLISQIHSNNDRHGL